MAKALESESIESPDLREIIAGVIIGALFISFSFPTGLEKLAKTTGWPVIGGLGAMAGSELNTMFGHSEVLRSTSIHYLWLLTFWGLAGYVLALAVLSGIHRRFDLLALGVAFLFLGTASIHIITWSLWLIGWALVILFVVLGFLWMVLSIIFGWLFHIFGIVLGFFGHIFAIIFTFFANTLRGIFEFFVKHNLWQAALVIIAVIVLFLVIKYWSDVRDFITTVGVIGLLIGAGILLGKLFALIWPLLKPFFTFLANVFGNLSKVLVFIGKILGYIGKILVPLFSFLLVGWILYGLGAFLMDTFRGAWHSGNGKRGVIICSLSVGALLAIILMETNLYNIVSLYPGYFSDFALHHLHENLPIVDMVVFALALLVSLLGVFRNVPKLGPEIALNRYQSGFFWIATGLVIGIVFVFIGAALAQGSSSS